ncbi:hypothetical protein [Candidatus Protochlamydia phocaeensis]|uniref:hypothetical protein n=1 Tax=Candidatus Protochlamydia phocaeensis TaxID=1414722 RepID=UPI000B110123|nr:hypothetical protein [Candidatus Protochlamydia phocaeensis]
METTFIEFSANTNHRLVIAANGPIRVAAGMQTLMEWVLRSNIQVFLKTLIYLCL